MSIVCVFMQRFVATLLLLWAVVDVCEPQLCQAEKISLPTTAQHAIIGAIHGRDLPSDGGEGDCFCCNTHVMASPQFEIAVALVAEPEQQVLALPHSDRHTQILYPPPRA